MTEMSESNATTTLTAGSDAEVPQDVNAVLDKQSPDWYNDFAQDDHKYLQTKGWSTPSDMLKSYRNLESYAGTVKSSGIPKDDDSEGWNKFYNQLGRPENPENYDFKEFKDNPLYDEEFSGHMAKVAHEAGITQKQLLALTKANIDYQQSYFDSIKKDTAKDMEDLKRDWGSSYDSKLAAGKKAVKELGLEESLAGLESALGTRQTMELFAKLGSFYQEPSFAGNEKQSSSNIISSALNQIHDLKLDEKFMKAYNNGDPAAKQRMDALYAMAYPS